jgi:hypothetical protein
MDEQDAFPPDDQWLIVHTPDQVYVWNLGQPDETTLDAALFAARTAVGFPAHDQWPGGPHSLGLAPGRPHTTLMARARVGALEQLAQVPADDVAAYRDQYASNVRQAAIDSAASVLAALDPAALAAVLDHPDVVAQRKATDEPLD